MGTREEVLTTSYEYILNLPKARRVQVNAVALIIIGSLPLASIFLIYSGVKTFRSLHQIGTHASLLYPEILGFVFPAILIVIGTSTYWKVRRDMVLLRDGELAIGVVTHQKLIAVGGGRGGRRKQSRIRYRFKDLAGQLFQGTGTDHSLRLRVDMTLPVFYNGNDPNKNVSICTAACELRPD